MPIFNMMSMTSDMTRLSILKSPPAQRCESGADARMHRRAVTRRKRNGADE